MSKNLSELSGRKGVVDNLFGKMGQAAATEGTPSLNDLEKLADEFLIGKSSVYGAVTFYDFMKPGNKGKKVYLCNGTACVCAGTQEAVQQKLENHFKKEEIGYMTCLGRCHENSAFHLNGHNYSGGHIDQIEKLVGEDHLPHQEKYHVQSHSRQVLTAEYQGFDKHYSVLKKALKKDPLELLEEIKLSNIRGRGGAGFPMGIKFETCRNMHSKLKFIICNADEGDPGAYSDRYLLEERPHSVLFGMMIAGFITGAEWGILYIRAEYPESVTIVQEAINELRENAMLGKDILESGFNFDFKIIKAQGAYICGEETALINSIEGQRPEVRVRPPFPAQQGLFNKPTIVNNVETLAALHFIIDKGGKAFSSLGTPRSTGTKLVCLDSFFNRPGIYEVEMGIPLSTVVHDLGKGFRLPVKALQIGGPLGGIVPVTRINDLTVDFESFAMNGFLLGHASVVSIPQSFPMIKFIEHLFEFAAHESCGKCFPCRIGTYRGFEMVNKAINSNYKLNRELMDDLLETLQIGSLCAHGGGIPLPVKNALQYFGAELKEYFEEEKVKVSG